VVAEADGELCVASMQFRHLNHRLSDLGFLVTMNCTTEHTHMNRHYYCISRHFNLKYLSLLTRNCMHSAHKLPPSHLTLKESAVV